MSEPFWSPSQGHEKSSEHAHFLGRLWTDLNSLETALRILFCEIEGVSDLQHCLHVIVNTKIGGKVSENAFTRHNQLHDLIESFNNYAVPRGASTIDTRIGELRHALAHGRVTSESEKEAIRLANFKRIPGGDITICFHATLTPEWVKQQRDLINSTTVRVFQFSKEIIHR